MKYCPLMSFQKQYCSEMMCMEEKCGWWDDRADQCAIKSLIYKSNPTPSNNIDSIISSLGGDIYSD